MVENLFEKLFEQKSEIFSKTFLIFICSFVFGEWFDKNLSHQKCHDVETAWPIWLMFEFKSTILIIIKSS